MEDPVKQIPQHDTACPEFPVHPCCVSGVPHGYPGHQSCMDVAKGTAGSLTDDEWQSCTPTHLLNAYVRSNLGAYVSSDGGCGKERAQSLSRQEGRSDMPTSVLSTC